MKKRNKRKVIEMEKRSGVFVAAERALKKQRRRRADTIVFNFNTLEEYLVAGIASFARYAIESALKRK